MTDYPSKIIQISNYWDPNTEISCLTVLCADGTLWDFLEAHGWHQIQPIPADKCKYPVKDK